MSSRLQIHPSDNVAVCLRAENGIPAGHKVALCDIPAGGTVIKYGTAIGRATADIARGEWVHTHNLQSLLKVREEYAYEPKRSIMPEAPKEPACFMGYRRADGRIGVRNQIWILPTVGCVGQLARHLADSARPYLHGNAEEVLAFAHPYGCSQLGGDQENTRRALAALATHPNAGGVLVLGLGCENSGVEEIRARMAPYDGERVRFLVCQEEEDETEAALKILRELMDRAASDQREKVGAEHLVLGLKCGGSDAFSGLTANPVLGALTDRIVSRGGACLLTEVPEMFGAERQLMERAESREVFEDIVHLISSFKEEFDRAGQPVYENPSPGNRAGGITTLEEKSLGCTQKSGHVPVRGVLRYAQILKDKGLHLAEAPGNDLVSSTALALSGAQMVLFTTGRGTPFSCPVPTVKISSRTELFCGKKNWIDFDAGGVLNGESLEKCAERLEKLVLRVASGEPVCAERAGLEDLVILKSGVTL